MAAAGRSDGGEDAAFAFGFDGDFRFSVNQDHGEDLTVTDDRAPVDQVAAAGWSLDAWDPGEKSRAGFFDGLSDLMDGRTGFDVDGFGVFRDGTGDNGDADIAGKSDARLFRSHALFLKWLPGWEFFKQRAGGDQGRTGAVGLDGNDRDAALQETQGDLKDGG